MIYDLRQQGYLLQGDIIGGVLGPGQQLVERELIRRFGVSRLVREALLERKSAEWWLAAPIHDSARLEDFAVFAGVLPEGKYNLVKAFQKNGHAVGMCGDGANDAPALRQAQMGIAVSTATDVAKSAAGIVLTEPGLSGIVASIREGRVTFQRILTYTLNSVIKKIVQVLFLAVGLIMTGQAILTPLLMVILMITGDFLAMSLTTDNVRPSPMPNTWQIGKMTIAGVIIGIGELIFCTAVLSVGKFGMGLGIDALRTLAMITLVFGGEATLFVVRERRRMWTSCPSLWVVMSSVGDVVIISALAIWGIAVMPLPVLGDRYICRCSRLRICPGPGEGAGVPSSRHLLKRHVQNERLVATERAVC